MEQRPRADARRNQRAVLDAAMTLFAVEGPDVPMERVASLAGVGMGTVYRHFPSKEALARAVTGARIEALVQELAEPPLAEAGVDALLLRLGSDRALHEALAGGLRGDPATLPEMAALRSTLARRLTRAQRQRELRPEVNLDDLLGFAAALSDAPEPERMVLLMLAGLAPG